MSNCCIYLWKEVKIMETIQQTRAWTGHNAYGRPFRALDVKSQLQVLLDEFGRARIRGTRNVGNSTVSARSAICFRFIDDVREAGYNIHNLLNIDQRHITAAIDRWKSDELLPSTFQNRFTTLRWLSISLGKRGLIRSPEYYGLEPEDVARTYVAESDKSWVSKGVISTEVVQSAKSLDPWVGHQLDLIRCFGLRVKEAIVMKPRIADLGTTLRVEEGTKGGRTRVVAIETPEQRAALDAAQQVALKSQRGSMLKPGMTLTQGKNRLYYVMRKLGITKDQLGVTPHGLRHEYANDLYEELSGNPSAVRGGTHIVDRAADEAARQAVTLSLGHSRQSITTAYTGPRVKGRPKTSAPSQAQA